MENAKEVDRCWKLLVQYLSPPSTITPEIKAECKELIESLENCGYPIRKCIGSWYKVKFKYHFKSDIMPEIMNILNTCEEYDAFEKIVTFLGRNILRYLLTFYLLEEIDSSFHKQIIYTDFITIMLECDPLKDLFTHCCVQFYKLGFDAFNKSHNFDEINQEDRVKNEERIKHFDHINRYMCCLYLFDDVALDAVLHVLNTQIKCFINDNFSGRSLDTSIISPVMSWLDSCVLPFIKFITQHFLAPPNLEMWKKRLKFFCYKTIGNIRINDLFEIMVDYPESHGAVMDIKKCLTQVQCHDHLVRSIQETFKERLLHPGANTEDIITQYSSAIKVLKFLDPSGAILERVCIPLRLYLKQRDDTIRCILNSLISKEDNELTRELTSTSGTLFKSNEDSDLENDDWEKWMPQSKDLPSNKHHDKSSDTITTLCSIYGSADVFVNEYRNLIADKLLTTSAYDIGFEMKSMELLKIGFGEDLNQCQIMLQDVIDSKRAHSNILSNLKQPLPFNINVIILSHVFWPNLRSEEIEVHPPLKEFLEGEYQKLFSELKRSRNLEWKYNLGFVELDLEFEDKVLSFTVSPIQATIIKLFEKSDKNHAETISNAIGLSLSQTRKKLAFWVTNGIIKETWKDMFELKTDVSSDRQTVVEEIDSAMVKIEEVREEELEGYTNFVMGLLNTSGQITVDRVHKLLSMLLSDSVAGQLTQDEVKIFLDKKVKQKLLIFSGGVYKKFK